MENFPDVKFCAPRISTTRAPDMKVGYDPKRSKVSDDKLAEFIRSAITGDITEVSQMRHKIVLRGENCSRRVFLRNMALRGIPGTWRGNHIK